MGPALASPARILKADPRGDESLNRWSRTCQIQPSRRHHTAAGSAHPVYQGWGRGWGWPWARPLPLPTPGGASRVPRPRTPPTFARLKPKCIQVSAASGPSGESEPWLEVLCASRAQRETSGTQVSGKARGHGRLCRAFLGQPGGGRAPHTPGGPGLLTGQGPSPRAGVLTVRASGSEGPSRAGPGEWREWSGQNSPPLSSPFIHLPTRFYGRVL